MFLLNVTCVGQFCCQVRLRGFFHICKKKDSLQAQNSQSRPYDAAVRYRGYGEIHFCGWILLSFHLLSTTACPIGVTLIRRLSLKAWSLGQVCWGEAPVHQRQAMSGYVLLPRCETALRQVQTYSLPIRLLLFYTPLPSSKKKHTRNAQIFKYICFAFALCSADMKKAQPSIRNARWSEFYWGAHARVTVTLPLTLCSLENPAQ